MMVIAPENSPVEPIPEIARPTINEFDDCAVAQTREPISKMHSESRKHSFSSIPVRMCMCIEIWSGRARDVPSLGTASIVFRLVAGKNMRREGRRCRTSQRHGWNETA